MKARQAVVCPKCGALNRSTWEFCARCNEALDGALPVEEGTSPTEAAEEGEGRTSSFGPNAIALGAAVALLVLGIAGWRYASQAPPLPRPDPSLFTVATQPPALPEAAPSTSPGAADFQEGR